MSVSIGVDLGLSFMRLFSFSILCYSDLARTILFLCFLAFYGRPM